MAETGPDTVSDQCLNTTQHVAKGHKRTLAPQKAMSASPPKGHWQWFVLSVGPGRFGRRKVIRALLALLRLLTLPQPDAWAAAVLVDDPRNQMGSFCRTARRGFTVRPDPHH
jgi:hypothetical protein